MTMTERRVQSIKAEIERLNKSLARYQTILSKKTAKAVKVNANWTDEEWYSIRDAGQYTAEQYEAHFEAFCARGDVEETEARIKNAEARLAKLMPRFEAEAEKAEEQERVSEIGKKLDSCLDGWRTMTEEERRREYEAWFKQFKADCLKDGIEIDLASSALISGKTKSGKSFWMEVNSGYTERSLHCYSLRIDGETVFTSGDFATAYNIIKR